MIWPLFLKQFFLLLHKLFKYLDKETARLHEKCSCQFLSKTFATNHENRNIWIAVWTPSLRHWLCQLFSPTFRMNSSCMLYPQPLHAVLPNEPATAAAAPAAGGKPAASPKSSGLINRSSPPLSDRVDTVASDLIKSKLTGSSLGWRGWGWGLLYGWPVHVSGSGFSVLVLTLLHRSVTRPVSFSLLECANNWHKISTVHAHYKFRKSVHFLKVVAYKGTNNHAYKGIKISFFSFKISRSRM